MEYRIGIDLGGTGIKAGVVDEKFNIAAQTSRPTRPERGFESVVDDMVGAARDAAAQVGMTLSDFPCLGVGTPSGVNKTTGLLVAAYNTNWRGVPLQSELKKHVSIPVRIENDANCAVIGEMLAGAARGCDDVMLLTLGTGVGGGVIIGGKLFSGHDGLGTELGHTAFVFGGEKCTCGIAGCFEAYASVTALIRQTRRAMDAHPDSLMHAHAGERGGKVDGRTSFDCAKQGDKAAQEVVDAYITYVAAGTGSLVSIFRPEIVLIGGGISAEGDYLIAPINERLRQYVFAGNECEIPKIVKATLGNSAGTIGAAFLDVM